MDSLIRTCGALQSEIRSKIRKDENQARYNDPKTWRRFCVALDVISYFTVEGLSELSSMRHNPLQTVGTLQILFITQDSMRVLGKIFDVDYRHDEKIRDFIDKSIADPTDRNGNSNSINVLSEFLSAFSGTPNPTKVEYYDLEKMCTSVLETLESLLKEILTKLK